MTDSVAANRRDIKNYTAFLMGGFRMQHTEALIRTVAEFGKVHTQPSQDYPEFLNILYWDFNISSSAVGLLRQRTGNDVCAMTIMI